MVKSTVCMPMRPHSRSPVINLPKAPQAAIHNVVDIHVSDTVPRCSPSRELLRPDTTVTAGIGPCYHKGAPWTTGGLEAEAAIILCGLNVLVTSCKD